MLFCFSWDNRAPYIHWWKNVGSFLVICQGGRIYLVKYKQVSLVTIPIYFLSCNPQKTNKQTNKQQTNKHKKHYICWHGHVLVFCMIIYYILIVQSKHSNSTPNKQQHRLSVNKCWYKCLSEKAHRCMHSQQAATHTKTHLQPNFSSKIAQKMHTGTGAQPSLSTRHSLSSSGLGSV